jgi:hypothetical protein
VKKVVQICRFYALRLYSMQPLAAALLAVAVVSLVISAGCWFVMDDIRRGTAAELTAFSTAHAKRVAAPTVAVAVAASGDRDLPAFSSAGLTANFHAVASDVKLPLDEVSYTLDSSANQPFLRYRVTLSVKTGYPEIRKFVAALIAELPNVALDSVRCGKEDVVATVLSCQLGFSAFYRKGGHG